MVKEMEGEEAVAAGFFVERKEGELELQPWGKERRRGAQLMEEEEEMGCSFSGACVRERGGDEGVL